MTAKISSHNKRFIQSAQSAAAAAQSAIEADNVEISDAQGQLDIAVASWNYDDEQYEAVTALLDQATALLADIIVREEDQENTFLTEKAWLEMNATYQQWVANGRPE